MQSFGPPWTMCVYTGRFNSSTCCMSKSSWRYRNLSDSVQLWYGLRGLGTHVIHVNVDSVITYRYLPKLAYHVKVLIQNDTSQIVQNHLVRVVLCLPSSASATDARHQLHWLPIKQRISRLQQYFSCKTNWTTVISLRWNWEYRSTREYHVRL